MAKKDDANKSGFYNFIDDSFFSYQFLTFGIGFSVVGAALIIVGAVLGSQLNKNTVSNYVNGNTLTNGSAAFSAWQNPGSELVAYVVPNLDQASIFSGASSSSGSSQSTFNMQLSLSRVNLTFAANGSISYRLQRSYGVDPSTATNTAVTFDVNYLAAVVASGSETTLLTNIDHQVHGFEGISDFFNASFPSILAAQTIATNVLNSITVDQAQIIEIVANDFVAAAKEYPDKVIATTFDASFSPMVSDCGGSVSAMCKFLVSPNNATATSYCVTNNFYTPLADFITTLGNTTTAAGATSEAICNSVFTNYGGSTRFLKFSNTTSLFACNSFSLIGSGFTNTQFNLLCTSGALEKMWSAYNSTRAITANVGDMCDINSKFLPNKSPTTPLNFGIDLTAFRLSSCSGLTLASVTPSTVQNDATIQAALGTSTANFKSLYASLFYAGGNTIPTGQNLPSLSNFTTSIQQLNPIASPLSPLIISSLSNLLFDSTNAAYLGNAGSVVTKAAFPSFGSANYLLGVLLGTVSNADLLNVPALRSALLAFSKQLVTSETSLNQLLYATYYPKGVIAEFFNSSNINPIELSLGITNPIFIAGDATELANNKAGTSTSLSGVLTDITSSNPFTYVNNSTLLGRYMTYLYEYVFVPQMASSLANGVNSGITATVYTEKISNLLSPFNATTVNGVTGLTITGSAGWENPNAVSTPDVVLTENSGTSNVNQAYTSTDPSFAGFEYHFGPGFVQSGASFSFFSSLGFANRAANIIPVTCGGSVTDPYYNLNVIQCTFPSGKSAPTDNTYLVDSPVGTRYLLPCELASNFSAAVSFAFDQQNEGTYINVEPQTGLTTSARTCFVSMTLFTAFPDTSLSAPGLANQPVTVVNYKRVATYFGNSAQVNDFQNQVNSANSKASAVLIALVVVGAVLLAIAIPLFVFYGIKKSREGHTKARQDLVQDPFHEMTSNVVRVAA